MNFVKLLPVIFSLLLLGAHFYRAGMVVLIPVPVIIMFLLLIRKPWVARLIQAVLVLGSIEWIRTLLFLVKMRQAAGAPWTRLAFILGGAALFTLCSALVFRARSLRERYKLTVVANGKLNSNG